MDHLGTFTATSPVRWYGGKGRLAAKIIPHLPPGRTYIEPYCGGASLFFHLPTGLYPVRVLNDLNGRIIGLFRTLQDPLKFRELSHRLLWTPYSAAEFTRAMNLRDDPDPVTAAWAFFVCCGQGFGGLAKTPGNWGKSVLVRRGMSGPCSAWRNRLAGLDHFHDCLTRVQLEQRDSLELIRYWDSPESVFYVDPPYAAATRADGYRAVYSHEADDDHHARLVESLLELRGRAILSGYRTPIYAPLERAGWRRIDFPTVCFAAGRSGPVKPRSQATAAAAATKRPPRIESIWISPAKSGSRQRLAA